MKQSLESSLVTFLKELPDPRVEGRCKHQLLDVVVISVCALLCGAESWVEIAEFGRQRFKWFKRYLNLKNGIPSHDTFARVFNLLEPKYFEKLFSQWADLIRGSLNKSRPKQHLCVDGKSISGTAGHQSGNSALHLVSVYCHSTGLVLSQIQGIAGHAESHAVLECLSSLDIRGALISADAANATRKVTGLIREKKAHYLVPLKGVPKNSLVKQLTENRTRALSSAEEKQTAHGRLEKRECRVFSATKLSEEFKTSWIDVQSILEITRTRKLRDYSNNAYTSGPIKTTIETMYYISSRRFTAAEALNRIREHWSIENQLHWQLDVSFREDEWQVRDKKAARTLALVRKMAFNLVKAFRDTGSVRVKMKRAAWSQDYLEKIVFNPQF